MSICQRKDGRYVVKYKDDAGRWRQKGFRDRAAAEAFEGENIYDESENSRLTVSESIVLFLKNTKHCRTGEQYYARILSRMPEMLVTKYVDALDRRDLENFRLVLKEDYRLSAQSINIHVGRLLAAWRWCASEDFLQDVPWTKYRSLPEPPRGHHCGDFADFMKAYSKCHPALQWLIRTCFALCLRPGKEAAGLRWRDVDPAHGKVNVWMPKVSRWKEVIAPAWWTEEARTRREGKAPEDRVCPNRKGAPWPARSIKAWYRACQLAGIGPIPLYTVRHMAASLMLEAGADPAAVAAQLGHSSVATTATFYTHAVAGAQKRAAGKLPSLPV